MITQGQQGISVTDRERAGIAREKWHNWCYKKLLNFFQLFPVVAAAASQQIWDHRKRLGQSRLVGRGRGSTSGQTLFHRANSSFKTMALRSSQSEIFVLHIIFYVIVFRVTLSSPLPVRHLCRFWLSPNFIQQKYFWKTRKKFHVFLTFVLTKTEPRPEPLGPICT